MFLEDDFEEEDYEIAIKVVVVGNGAVGKTSLIQRYCKGIFTSKYKKTIGVDFLEKQITASGEDCRLMLWDTAGQEEFDAITKAYYRGAQACIIAFSTTDRTSFEAVKKWKRKVEDECGHVPMVLVQNKIDLLHEAQVDSHEVEKLARNTGIKLFRSSVKENLNVNKIFQHLAERHVEAVSRWSDEADSPTLQIGQYGTRSDIRVRFAGFPTVESSGGKGFEPASQGKKFHKFHSRQEVNKMDHKMDYFQSFYVQPGFYENPMVECHKPVILCNPFRKRPICSCHKRSGWEQYGVKPKPACKVI